MAEKRSALVVATSQYEDARLAPLAGPGRDAEALEKVLGDAEIGGFDVQLALNTPLAELRTTLDSFFADAARDDLLLVHFSGHGLKDDDGQLYLAAADTRIDRLLSTAVEASWVNKLMAKCRSDKIALFLDCCFGGAFTAGLTRRAGVDTAGSKETFSGSGRFVITASDAMQYSFEGGQRVEGSEPEPSPFTRALVEGLTTGEADRNDDGFVSINELFDYLEDRVRQLSPAQTPTKSAFNQVGDWVIAQSMRAPTIRILPVSLQEQLKSDAPLERMGAAFVLKDLIQGGDPRTADAARKALERLTGDDSRLVAEAAERLFGGTPPENRPEGVVTTTTLSDSPLPPELIKALGGTPVAKPSEPPVKEADPVATASAEPAASGTEPPTATAAVQPSTATQPPVQPPPVQPPAVTPTYASASSAAGTATGPARAGPPEAASTTAPQPARAPWTPPASTRPPDGPLWGPATGAAPPPPVNAASIATTAPANAATIAATAPASATTGWQPPPRAISGAGGSTSPPWSAGRAAGRAFLGVLLGGTLSEIYYAATDYYTSASDIAGDLGVFLVIAGIVAGIVVAVEKVVPALRIPGGRAYRLLGNNRWIVPVVVSLPLGILLALGTRDIVFLVLVAAGFLVAEAIVDRRGSTANATS